MKLFSKSSVRSLNGDDRWTRLSRVLTFLLLLLIVLTPITQSIWDQDNFLQASGDTEYTLMVALTFAALGLLLSNQKAGAFEQDAYSVPRHFPSLLFKEGPGYSAILRAVRLDNTCAIVAGLQESRLSLPLLI